MTEYEQKRRGWSRVAPCNDAGTVEAQCAVDLFE